MTWAYYFWDSFRTGFWFVPSLAIVLGIVASVAMPEIDQLFAESLPSWINSNESTGRTLLTTLIGAMFTVTGIVFSVSVVALSITASQLGPRLLRNFMSQAIAQITLGICVATSIYCLLILRHIDRVQEEIFVPHLSIFVAIILAMLSLCVVVLFMHRVTIFIQAPNVVAAVAHELDETIDRLYPEMLGEESEEYLKRPHQSAETTFEGYQVKAAGEGYLQAIDTHGIMEVAKEYDLRLQLHRKPGDFIVRGTRLASVSGGRERRKEIEKKMAACYIYGTRPTPRQDVKCAIREMVEIAVRALSPGINDPFTAMSCIDWLSASLRRLANRQFPSPYRFDGQGQLRVIAHQSSFEELFESAFDPLRQYSAGSLFVTIRLLEALETISRGTNQPGVLVLVAHQADKVVQNAAGKITCESDRKKFHQLAERIRPPETFINSSQQRLKSISL